MSESDITVSYVKEYQVSEGVLLPKWAYLTYSTSGVKRYHAAIYHLCGITGFTRDLIDWLTGEMNLDNIVHNDQHTKARLYRFYRETKQKPPSASMINRSFRILAEKKLLIQRGRGTYMVNPEFFMNSANEESRSRLLKIILEFENDKETTIRVER